MLYLSLQVDELQGGKVSLGLSIVVRITLKDGTYHEVNIVALGVKSCIDDIRTSDMAP